VFPRHASPVPILHAARYHIDIGLHVFPTRKYQLVVRRLVEAGLVQAVDVIDPPAASWSELALVHTEEYLARMRDGSMSAGTGAARLPWSREMVESFRVMVGGTTMAARLACGPAGVEPAPAIACHIGGGLHHAFPNHGEGFCPFNDVAVAVRVLQGLGVSRHAIVDLDVHHGNGTSFIFESDPRVHTLSIHQQHNYPMWKPRNTGHRAARRSARRDLPERADKGAAEDARPSTRLRVLPCRG
jgi:acetoin utilization deacetylase AcuC-like enzyme